jgi:hypothetical protein
VRSPFAILSLLAFATVCSAAPAVWELNTNTSIYVVNAATNAEILYGTNPFQSDSLARSPSAKLFSADANGTIWDVTAGPIPMGPTGRTLIGDLDWAAPGGVWGFSNTSSELFFFNFGSSSVTSATVITGLGASTVTGVAFQPSSGDIFLSGNVGLNTDQLFRVPFSGSSAQLIGGMPIGDAFSYISDIDFDPTGNLYAMTFFHREFYKVNITTAATTLVSTGPHRDTTAMALNSVPEPASVLALAGGALLAARRRKTI